MKYWASPIYAFFDSIPQIVEYGGHVAHKFKCSRHECQVAPVCCFLDTKDVHLTGNICKYIHMC
ncbi:hypothetical protein J3R82DRAFT_10581, partial [Butyriboletus roseoflavus]